VKNSKTSNAHEFSKSPKSQLPSLGRLISQREEVEQLWTRLHIAPESRPRFDRCKYTGCENMKEFEFFQTETLRLKNLVLDLYPILEHVNQREDIREERSKMKDEKLKEDRSRKVATTILSRRFRANPTVILTRIRKLF
jgi:hypothetical protein